MLQKDNVLKNNSHVRSTADMTDIYFSLEQAKQEIHRRWNDKELREKVEKFFNGGIPEIFRDSPTAILGRQIVSPNFEALNFLELAKQIDLAPYCFGYLDDKLVTKNLDKYFLCKMYFDSGIGRNGGKRLSAITVVDFNLWNGKSLREVKTIFGSNFFQFHESLMGALDTKLEFFDASKFLKKNGGQGSLYYQYYLALFICHGVLFENYLLGGEYAVYSDQVFSPSYQKVVDMFGVRPLIVRVAPVENEEDVRWRHYPGALYGKIKEMSNKNK